MGIVTFFEDIDYNGNSRTIDIGDRSAYQILLYKNTETPITIRSIQNHTNYIITLYYKKDSNAFGDYIYIDKDISDIQQVQHPSYYFWTKEVSPLFSGIVLERKPMLYFTVEYNYVIRNLNLFKPYDENVLDLRNELKKYTENVQTQPTPQQQQTDLQYASVTESAETDKYNECRNNREELIRKVHLKQMLYGQCQDSNKIKFDTIKNNHAEQKAKLGKELQKLQQENKNLKTKGTTGNKNSMYSYFFAIVDLLMLFYILYKHNLFRMK